MVSIAALWLPIVLSAVLVFVVSSIIHMVMTYHRKDHRALPEEEPVRAALGRQTLTKGQYFIPYAPDMKAMKEPDVQKRFTEGPVAIITVFRSGLPNMGTHLIQWFLYSLGIAFVVAYVLSRTVPADAPYMHVFRVASTITWLGYAGGHVWAGIWKGVPWSTVLKDAFDSLLFALVTGGAFAGFWPR